MNSVIGLKEAAKRLEIAPITLKRWFLEGKISEVDRDRNGWRIFSNQDIERIQRFVTSGTKSPAKDAERPKRKYKVASVFSGIGGFDIGFEEAGFEVTFQCELNEFCQNILAKHWPKVSRFSDIKELNHANVPVSDVWVGGFPCQDVSLARMGKRDGLRGRQSGLFYEFARLVGESRPRVLIIENVHGLLSSHKGVDFGVVLGTLAELGYSVGWRTLNSKDFGVPQSRRRVFIVACYRDRRGPAAILFEPERSEGHSTKSKKDGETALSPFKRSIEFAGKEGAVTQSIAYCLYASSARHTGTDWSRTYVSYPRKGKVRRLTPSECEGVMGFPQGWTIPEGELKGSEDVDSARYHALGNAVTPPVVKWLAQRTRAYLEAVDAERDAQKTIGSA